MKNIIPQFLLIIFLVCPLHAQTPIFRKVTNHAFARGEKLTYKIHYGFIDAVRATIEIAEDNKKFGSHNTLHVIGSGISRGSFDFFFKVRDRYESYIDEEAMIPWFFGRRVDEGGYRMAQDYIFNHKESKVTDKDKTYPITENCQDMLSAFFYARTLPLGESREGQVYSMPTIVDGEMYNLQIRYKGRQVVKTEFGKIRCLKFVPIVQKGRIFKHEEDLIVWVSDDKNHIPIRAKAEILFGSLKVDLIDFKGLVNPMAKL